MDRTEKLKELFAPVFADGRVRLYDLVWRTGKENVLEVSIIKDDGTMDLDTCAQVSEKLSEILDQNDEIQEEYTLEVCSPGAEREIKDLQELDHMQGEYVYVKFREPVRKMMEVTGTILSVENDVITLEYRDKAARRKAEVTKENIAFIRLAVKI